MSNYSNDLKDPRWQKKRLEVMQRDEFQCSRCGDKESMLAVHHLFYISGRKPWQYPIWSLQTLCDPCHSGHHDPSRCQEKPAGAENPESEFEAVIGFLGFNHPIDFSEKYWDIGVESSRLITALGGGDQGREDFRQFLMSSILAKREELDRARLVSSNQ